MDEGQDDNVERIAGKLLAVLDRAYRDGKPVRNKTEAVRVCPGKTQDKNKAWDRLLEQQRIEPHSDGWRVADSAGEVQPTAA